MIAFHSLIACLLSILLFPVTSLTNGKLLEMSRPASTPFAVVQEAGRLPSILTTAPISPERRGFSFLNLQE